MEVVVPLSQKNTRTRLQNVWLRDQTLLTNMTRTKYPAFGRLSNQRTQVIANMRLNRYFFIEDDSKNKGQDQFIGRLAKGQLSTIPPTLP